MQRETKLWEKLKIEFNLLGQMQFIYNQIIHYILKTWKDALTANLKNIKNLVFLGHRLIKNYQIYCLNKLNSKEIYSIIIESTDSKPSSKLYYNSFFKIHVLIGKLFVWYLYSCKRLKTSIISIQTFKKCFISK